VTASEPPDAAPPAAPAAVEKRVGWAELFFDLVFVFVITQATLVVEEHPDWTGIGHALLPLVLVWWMFLAFGWLTNAVRPDAAIFGQKDFQQLAVVRRMVADLDLGIEIVGLATVREPDGLALSSRNRRLEPDDRAAAVCISRALGDVRDAFAEGERNAARLAERAAAVITSEPRARLEYLAVNDASSLAPVEVVTDAVVVSCAVWFGEVRLIDNVVLDPIAG